MINKNNINSSKTKDYVLKPSQILIDNWSFWIAKEIVSKLKSRTTLEVDFGRFYSLFEVNKIDDMKCVWNNFEFQFDKIKSNFDSSKNYQSIKQKLDKNFAKIVLDGLKKINKVIADKLCNSLEEYMSDNFQKSSPENTINSLKDFSKILLSQRRNLENNRYAISSKINSVFQAYKNLIDTKNINTEKESIWNALRLLFQYQFEKEKEQILSGLILNLLQIVQTYYDSAQKTYLFLSNVEKSISDRCSMDLVSFPAFMYFNSIDINHQQFALDLWIGHSINKWGDSLVTIEEFAEKILDNAGEISRNLFYKFQIDFLENIVIKNKC